MKAFVFNVLTGKIIAWFDQDLQANEFAAKKNVEKGRGTHDWTHTDYAFENAPKRANPIFEAAAKEIENHIPTTANSDWITCSCGHTVKPSYWTRHITGADGSATAPKLLERAEDYRLGVEDEEAETKAEALREAAQTFQDRLPDGSGNGRLYNSWRVAQILRDRADSLTKDSK